MQNDMEIVKHREQVLAKAEATLERLQVNHSEKVLAEASAKLDSETGHPSTAIEELDSLIAMLEPIAKQRGYWGGQETTINPHRHVVRRLLPLMMKDFIHSHQGSMEHAQVRAYLEVVMEYTGRGPVEATVQQALAPFPELAALWNKSS